MQGCDHLPTQGLPPPHDHVDGTLPVEESLDGLLLVLVDEVHIVDSQQPVIDPKEGQRQASVHAGLGTSGQPLPHVGSQMPENRFPTYTFKTFPLRGESNG